MMGKVYCFLELCFEGVHLKTATAFSDFQSCRLSLECENYFSSFFSRQYLVSLVTVEFPLFQFLPQILLVDAYI